MTAYHAPTDLAAARPRSRTRLFRLLVVGITAFLTLVDLFATQAILPTLTAAYHTTPAMMGFAVNASTMGMAAAGIVVALFSRHINRRLGIAASLALLSVPTALLGTMPEIMVFTVLRVAQGVFMSTAFTLTMAYLAEETSGEDTARALAAYITGNVASNLFGRLMAATFVDFLGLAPNFYVFAALNLAGAVLVALSLKRCAPAAGGTVQRSALSVWAEHFRNPPLRAAFAIGFIILFAFIGTFTFVNFVLARPPIALSPMSLGLVYFVFLPSILTTPLAGHAVKRFGTRSVFWGALAVAAAGLPLVLAAHLDAVLAGLALIAVGTFFAQAAATGFVGRAATTDRGAASGIYLACYYLGGLAGSAVLGPAFDRLGWSACVAGIAIALALAGVLAVRLELPAMAHARTGGCRTATSTHC
ncbi:MAG: MFS transporter [Alphaproteobacteria bacterium]